jgi:hypothetical protein
MRQENGIRPNGHGAMPGRPIAFQAPKISDHESPSLIGCGAYGEVWLARNVVGTLFAVETVRRHSFVHAEHRARAQGPAEI